MLLIVFLTVSLWTKGQTFSYRFQQVTLQTDGYRQHLEQLEKFGERRAGLPGLDSARIYISNTLNGWGYRVTLDTFNFGGFEQYNVIAEKKGSGSEVVLVGAHYDSKGGPGSNDNGSGVASVLTAAKAMSSQHNKRTLLFCFYAAEESNLIGSMHHAAEFNGYSDLYLMFNVDQVAGIKDGQNQYILVERDDGNVRTENDVASALMADTISKLCQIYTNLEPRIDRAFSSDYMSYERYGAVIAGLYHNNYGSFTHSSQDLLKNMDTATLREVVKLTIATCLYFVGNNLVLSAAQHRFEPNLRLYPNPAKDHFTLVPGGEVSHLEIVNSLGVSIRKIKLSIGQTTIQQNISDLQPGIYWLVVANHLGLTQAFPLLVQHEH